MPSKDCWSLSLLALLPPLWLKIFECTVWNGRIEELESEGSNRRGKKVFLSKEEEDEVGGCSRLYLVFTSELEVFKSEAEKWGISWEILPPLFPPPLLPPIDSESELKLLLLLLLWWRFAAEAAATSLLKSSEVERGLLEFEEDKVNAETAFRRSAEGRTAEGEEDPEEIWSGEVPVGNCCCPLIE